MIEPPASAPPRRAALAFILITVALDVLALGMIIPVLPKLIMGFTGGDTAGAARVYGVFGTVWALMQFLCSPVLGMLSDRWGRRPVVLLSNFGLGLDYILMAMAPTLGWLFVGRVISGITAASIPAAMAYIADVTVPEKRASAFGMIGAAFGLGFLLGPAVGGILGDVNPHLPFWVAAGLSLANALYGLLVLPESLPSDQRTNFAWSKANPLGSLKLLRSHTELLGLAIVNFIAGLAHEVFPSVFVLYASHRYGWDAKSVGLTLAGAGICGAVVQMGLVPSAVLRLGERRMLLVGLAFGVAGAAIYGLAPVGWVFLCAIPVMSLWGMSGPATHGLMTRRVLASEQGQLQGANSSLRGIAGMLGPLMFTLTYAAFIDDRRDWSLPGAPFLLAALLLLLSLVMAWRVTRAELASPA